VDHDWYLDEQNWQITTTPHRAESVGEITRRLSRNESPPNVHIDRNSGPHSGWTETKKLLQHSSTTVPAVMMAILPLPDVLGSAEVEPRTRSGCWHRQLWRECGGSPAYQNSDAAAELMQRLRQLESDWSTFGSGKNRLKQVEQLERLSW
jgi:hypothetical protein